MGKHVTHKRTAEGRHRTIERKQARALKREGGVLPWPPRPLHYGGRIIVIDLGGAL